MAIQYVVRNKVRLPVWKANKIMEYRSKGYSNDRIAVILKLTEAQVAQFLSSG